MKVRKGSRGPELLTRVREAARRFRFKQEFEDAVQSAFLALLDRFGDERPSDRDVLGAVARIARTQRGEAARRADDVDVDRAAERPVDAKTGLMREGEPIPPPAPPRKPEQPAGTLEIVQAPEGIEAFGDRIVPARSWVTPVVGWREYLMTRRSKEYGPIAYARMRDQASPSAAARLAAAAVLEQVIRPILEPRLVAPEHEQAVIALYETLHGHGVEGAWIEPLVENIRRAKNADINARTAAATRGDPMPSSKRVEQAKRALHATKTEIATWPVRIDLPTWIDSPWVVAVLVGRIAVGSGAGGRGRLMTAASVGKLLAEPTRLADELEAMLGKVDGEGEAVRQLTEAVRKVRAAVRGARRKKNRSKTKG